MQILKLGKCLLPWVLCCSLLNGCDSSDTMSSLADAQQQMMHQTPSVWAAIGKQLELTPTTPRPEVAAQIHWLQANKDWLYPTLKSSALYINYVFEQTQKRHLPAELALLPVLESDGDPTARSRVGASGMWQLMPATAKDLGVKNLSDYDGRKDVVASTDAALNFLADLHQSFHDDWFLAMGAYNSGPGIIQAALRQQHKWYRSTTFWDLSSLPIETKLYVPRLLALATVIRDPERYGFTLPEIENKTRLAPVKVASATELKQVAQATGVSIETVKHFNPAYRNLKVATGAPNTFLIPVENPTLRLTRSIADGLENNQSLINTLLWNGKALAVALTSNPSGDNLAVES